MTTNELELRQMIEDRDALIKRLKRQLELALDELSALYRSLPTPLTSRESGAK